MQFKEILTDDDAVSPVIGVILMVAITVILAAVIASFVLGLGDTAQQTTPQASFSFDYEKNSATGTTGLNNGTADGDLTITHDGGDNIEDTRVSVVDDDGNSIDPFSSELAAGTSETVVVDHNDVIRVVYKHESGDSSSTLATWEAPNA